MLRHIAAAFVFAVVTLSLADAQTSARDGGDGYEGLVSLYDAFLEWKDNPPEVGEVGDSVPWVTIEDWSDKTVRARRDRIARDLARLEAMDVSAWPRDQQADFLAVRAKLQEENFRLNISRPWSRDPGYYVDQMLYPAFTELPVEGEARKRLEAQLRAIPILVTEAKTNLDEAAADYAMLARRNLREADGVGHGHPYREVPPPGVIGWYEDLSQRAKSQQKDILPLVEEAAEAVRSFDNWLAENEEEMTADAGVGAEAFDWYLKNVKLMPYTSDDIVTLGLRETDRLWALYALERHKNRGLPELEPAASKEEYEKLIAQTDRKIRRFLEDEDIITVPDDIGPLSTNVPWIVRSGGRNFWEEVQYRDPSPDHLHAVIPGHRFDGVMEDRNDHPIRGRLTDGVRAEGWGVYLEEAAMELGLFDDNPRVRELIYIFGIFRAARAPADVWLQQNEMTVEEVIAFWRERTPYLDANVARVDAEIYLRRPPGYGLGYTIGMVQMQKLLADARRLQGEDFDLEAFHDNFMATGRLPMSLVRWEMTGLDDEVAKLWQSDPLPRSR
jgi:uncharacterized protein (DUF885 family)